MFRTRAKRFVKLVNPPSKSRVCARTHHHLTPPPATPALRLRSRRSPGKRSTGAFPDLAHPHTAVPASQAGRTPSSGGAMGINSCGSGVNVVEPAVAPLRRVEKLARPAVPPALEPATGRRCIGSRRICGLPVWTSTAPSGQDSGGACMIG